MTPPTSSYLAKLIFRRFKLGDLVINYRSNGACWCVKFRKPIRRLVCRSNEIVYPCWRVCKLTNRPVNYHLNWIPTFSCTLHYQPMKPSTRYYFMPLSSITFEFFLKPYHQHQSPYLPALLRSVQYNSARNCFGSEPTRLKNTRTSASALARVYREPGFFIPYNYRRDV